MFKLIARVLKLFQLCHQCLSILHYYFDGPTKLFSDLYLAKFLNTSAKSFFREINISEANSFGLNVS